MNECMYVCMYVSMYVRMYAFYNHQIRRIRRFLSRHFLLSSSRAWFAGWLGEGQGQEKLRATCLLKFPFNVLCEIPRMFPSCMLFVCIPFYTPFAIIRKCDSYLNTFYNHQIRRFLSRHLLQSSDKAVRIWTLRTITRKGDSYLDTFYNHQIRRFLSRRLLQSSENAVPISGGTGPIQSQ